MPPNNTVTVDAQVLRLMSRFHQLRHPDEVPVKPPRPEKVKQPVSQLALKRAKANQFVNEDIAELVELVQRKTPGHVAQWLRNRLNQHLDEELEVLATHVLAEMELPTDFPEVRGPLLRGNYDEGLRQLTSRLRRRFAKLLRDHQRGEDDEFYDACTVE